MRPPASAPSATRKSAPHLSYITARRPDETIPAKGVSASKHHRITSREIPAPCTMKLTPSSSAARASCSKSSWLMAAMRSTPTYPPAASARARRSSRRSISGVFPTAETVPTVTNRAPPRPRPFRRVRRRRGGPSALHQEMSARLKDAFDRGASQRWSPRVRRRGRRERDRTAWLRAVAHHEILRAVARRGRPHSPEQAVEWARPKVGQPLGRWEACELTHLSLQRRMACASHG